jgi:hypothetical protein
MDELSIDSVSAMQQGQLKSQVDMTVAKKTLDVQREQGDAAVALIKAAADAAPKPEVKNGRVDGYA